MSNQGTSGDMIQSPIQQKKVKLPGMIKLQQQTRFFMFFFYHFIANILNRGRLNSVNEIITNPRLPLSMSKIPRPTPQKTGSAHRDDTVASIFHFIRSC